MKMETLFISMFIDAVVAFAGAVSSAWHMLRR
jgi:hypothetical protein